MSAPLPLEATLLTRAQRYLDDACAQIPVSLRVEAKLQLLEATAGRIGTFDTKEYFTAFRIAPLFHWSELDRAAATLVECFRHLPMHPSLALSALARQPIAHSEQRQEGAYYTDFRLATLVATIGSQIRASARPVIDPASGTGILLAALSLAVCGHDRKKIARWLSTSVYAADKSAMALRGACLSLASLTDDLSAVVAMRRKWYVGDSLMRSDDAWTQCAPHGFGLVVANPPWEKLKITRHEFAKANGAKTHYGATQQHAHLVGIDNAKAVVSRYAKDLIARYPLAAGAEVDTYAVFSELFIRLARDGGAIAALLPGGLIRSQSTEPLREELAEAMAELSLGVIDNHARFFQIDTRFKFLLVAGRTKKQTKARTRITAIGLKHYHANEFVCEESGAARIPMRVLERIRPDLSVPEVKTNAEWRLFSKASANGTPWDREDSEWRPQFCREVDMTKERPKFRSEDAAERVPVVEGRMVHQHRFGAKAYQYGTGRRARWLPLPLGASVVKPQFFISTSDLSPSVRSRLTELRAGFCDIAGQTNERSMMAALIPPSVVCGNKVPTLTFPGKDGHARLLLWVGLVNSFPFDWMLRRVLTTTVNYFLLRSVALPKISPSSLPGRRIIHIVRQLDALDKSGGGDGNAAWQAANLRAEIDVACARGYGLEFSELRLMLEDFPSLDRSQPALPGEPRSTITKDFLLMFAARKMRADYRPYERRVNAAIRLGATAYVPSQVTLEDDDQGQVKNGYRA